MADRSPGSQHLSTLLEQLALKVVMLEEDDVQGLGGFLTQLEELQAQVSQAQELAPLFQDLNEVGQRLVLQEVDQVAQGLELLNQGWPYCRNGPAIKSGLPPARPGSITSSWPGNSAWQRGKKHRRRRRRPWCPRSGMPRSW